MRSRILLPLIFALASACFANVKINTTSLPNGVLNHAYSTAVTAGGGCSPYKWKLTSGSLPTGVTMKSSTTKSVTLSGSPTKAATYSFSISATGCGGKSASASYKIVVQNGANHIVNLSWNASTSNDVAGYNVYRGPDGKSWTKINVSLTASTQYTDSTVANGTTYFYATTAVDIQGNESARSNVAKSVVP